jgi:aspartate/methionine/tyrosine aminotransferase
MTDAFDIAGSAQAMPQSGIREVFEAAKEYDDVRSLGIGEPDFDTPRPIAEAVSEALGTGIGSYTDGVGRRDLRGALAEKLDASNGVSVDPDSELIVTPGAMGALFAAVNVVCEPGDEVLVPTPYWPNYRGHLVSAGATMVPVPTTKAERFVPRPEDVADAVTDDTVGMILNTPTNPTGAVVPPRRLEAIGGTLAEHGLWAILDETYEDLVYEDATHHSLASDPDFFERSITVHTFSKSFAMTGWRLGYAAAPAAVVDRMAVLQEHASSCAAEPSQVAAKAALGHPGIVEEIHGAFARRRDLLLDRLSGIPGVDPGEPRGAFYVFADVSDLTDDTWSFVMDLLDEVQVAAVPGTEFGETGAGFLRFSYATDERTIAEAMDRFERFVDGRR